MLPISSAVADPGFPRGGGANSRGTPTYDFAKFSQKLHEIERIWTPGGVPRAPLRSATDQLPRTHFRTWNDKFLMVSLLIITTCMKIRLHAANKKASHPPTSLICYCEVHWIAVTASSVSTNTRLQGTDFLASKL